MVSQKKKLAFYSVLSSGHLNICASLGTVLLNHFAGRIEVYFIVDEKWQKHLTKIDSRFKFGVFKYDKKDDDQRMAKLVDGLEASLSMNLVDKAKLTWELFVKDPTLLEVDTKSEQQIKLIQPDFLLCDQGVILPAMINAGRPYGFVVSTNPLILDLDGFPKNMCDAGVDEPDKIRKFNDDMKSFYSGIRDYLYGFHKERNSNYEPKDSLINQIRSDHFIIYSFPKGRNDHSELVLSLRHPKELDYFSDELKAKYKLLQIDGPLFPERLPEPYKLPESFAALPGRLVYLSLGSLFSAYTHRLQKLVDSLEKLPGYKYIVSKGPNGDSLVFPSERFIGENYVDQLRVLALLGTNDGLMIAHGGNNTLGECFYFGVPCVIFPVLGDQINNAQRIVETGFGFKMDLMNFDQEELAEKLDKLANDEGLRRKWKEASSRIQGENRIAMVAKRVFEYIERLQS